MHAKLIERTVDGVKLPFTSIRLTKKENKNIWLVKKIKSEGAVYERETTASVYYIATGNLLPFIW